MDRSPGHGSRPHTPHGHGPQLLFSSFYYPVPFSPTALQVAAAYPSTPTRGHGQMPHGGPHHHPGFVPAPYPGSPMMAGSPGQVVFAQYFSGGPPAAQPMHAPQEAMERATSSSSDLGGSDGCGGIEVTPGAHQLAASMLATQNLQGEPPLQLLELASLLQTYGLVNAGDSGVVAAPPPAVAGTSPDKGGKVSQAAFGGTWLDRCAFSTGGKSWGQ